MINYEMIRKDMFKVKKVKTKDDSKVGIVAYKYTTQGISESSIALIGLDGKKYNCSLDQIEVGTTRVMNDALKSSVDLVIKTLKEFDKIKLGLLEKKKGYTAARLTKSETKLQTSIDTMKKIYQEVYKEEIQKEKDKKAKEAKKQRDAKKKAEEKAAKEKAKLEKEAKAKELKRIKSLKICDKPKYTGGGFIILEKIEEDAKEYDSDVDYTATVYLKTDAALNRLKKICRYASPRKTYEYDAKYKTKVRVDSGDYWDIEKLFGDAYLKNKLEVGYHNHYEDDSWSTTISVPSFKYTQSDDKYSVDEYSSMGSSADGDSFTEFLEGLRRHKILK